MEPNDIFSKLYPASPELTSLPKNMPIGMAYVPVQQMGNVYDAETAYKRGTLYPDLDKPYLEGRGMLTDG